MSGIRAHIFGRAVGLILLMAWGQCIRADGEDSTPYQGTMLDNVQRFTLDSQHAGAEYQVFVALPLSYGQGTDSYPVLVVLDAPYSIGTAIETARTQAIIGEVRELIVVGVGADSVAAQGPRRMRDFSIPRPAEWYEETAKSGNAQMRAVLQGLKAQEVSPEEAFGGAELFYRFLDGELLPWLTERFRIDRSDLGIFGHSAAGGFLNYILLHHPDPFAKLIIGSSISEPFEEDFESSLAAFAAQTRPRPTAVFSAFGEVELGTPMLGPMFRKVMESHEQLAAAAPGNLRVETRIFDDETHTSVSPQVIASGIRFMWGTERVFGDVTSPSGGEQK